MKLSLVYLKFKWIKLSFLKRDSIQPDIAKRLQMSEFLALLMGCFQSTNSQSEFND